MTMLSSSSAFSFTDDLSQASTVRNSNVAPERRGRMQKIQTQGSSNDAEEKALAQLSLFVGTLRGEHELEAFAFRDTFEIVADSPVDQRMGLFSRFLSRRSYLDDVTRTSLVNAFDVIAGLDGNILRHNLNRHGLLNGTANGTAGGSTGTLTTVPNTVSSGESKDEEYALMQLSVDEGTLLTLPEREANRFRGHLVDSAADNRMTSVSIFLSCLNDEARTTAEEAFRVIVELGGHMSSPNLQHHGSGNAANVGGACGSNVGTVSSTSIAGGNSSTLVTVPLPLSTSEVVPSNDVQLVANLSLTDPSFQSTSDGPAQQGGGIV